MFGEEDALSEFFGEVKAGDEQQAQTAGGAASASTSYARVKDSAADRRISDFFGQARVEARRGAPGVKAGSLADHVHEGGLGLSSESSVLHGNPVSPEAGSIPLVGAQFQPPRTVLALALFRELASRIDHVWSDKDRLKEVQSMGWLDTSLHWKYQLWNPTLKCLQEDKERKPVPNEEMKQLLEQLYAALKGPVVTRFHCTRKLTEIMESQATFFFDLSTTGQQAWDLMMKLQGSCVLQLVGVAYKKAGLRRGPMAEKIREMIGQR